MLHVELLLLTCFKLNFNNISEICIRVPGSLYMIFMYFCEYLSVFISYVKLHMQQITQAIQCMTKKTIKWKGKHFVIYNTELWKSGDTAKISLNFFKKNSTKFYKI